MIWILFLLAVAGVVSVFVWDFRRKAAAREAESKRRFEEMFMARSAAAPRPDSPLTAPMPAAAHEATPAVAPAVAAPAAIASTAAARFLGQRETLLYRLLRAGIPDHEIFANVALASVVGGRNEQESRRLAQYRLDFVVCDKAMHVVAAVEFEAGGNMQAVGEQRFKADSLKAAGINLVRINPAALPKRDDLRALVCGKPGAAA